MDQKLTKRRIYRDSIPLRTKFVRLLWGIVYVVCFRFTPRLGMNRWRIFLLRCFGAEIGQGCRIAQSTKIWLPSKLSLGDQVCLAERTDIYTVSAIRIGSNVAVSQGSYLCTASHDISKLDRPLISRPIAIGDHAWICAEAFIGPGVTIGEGAVVGARAVVTKDVPAWTVVAGNPAVEIKKRIIREEEP